MVPRMEAKSREAEAVALPAQRVRERTSAPSRTVASVSSAESISRGTFGASTRMKSVSVSLYFLFFCSTTLINVMILQRTHALTKAATGPSAGATTSDNTNVCMECNERPNDPERMEHADEGNKITKVLETVLFRSDNVFCVYLSPLSPPLSLHLVRTFVSTHAVASLHPPNPILPNSLYPSTITQPLTSKFISILFYSAFLFIRVSLLSRLVFPGSRKICIELSHLFFQAVSENVLESTFFRGNGVP